MKTMILPLTAMAALAAFVLSISTPSVDAQDKKEKPAASGFKGSKWEYRAVRINDRRVGPRDRELGVRKSSSQDTLNQLGEQGWELVAVRNDTNSEVVFYFKRPK